MVLPKIAKIAVERQRFILTSFTTIISPTRSAVLSAAAG